MRRSASARIMGWSSRSSACLAAGSENTRLRIASRSTAPCAVMNAFPNWLWICGSAAPPASVSSRAMASVSMTVAPSRANSSAAALLPLPMPPVSPTTNFTARTSQPVGVPAQDRLAPEERDQGGDGDVGPEVETKAGVPLAARGEHLQSAEGEADERGEQDHERQHLPAEKRADRGVHLEVAVAHAVLAGGKLVGPEDEPQREIPGNRADHGLGQGHERAAQIDDQPHPQERQRQVVRQEPGLLVDEGERDGEPDEERRAERGHRGAEVPGGISGADTGEELDQRVTRADLGAALRALALQHEPAEQ